MPFIGKRKRLEAMIDRHHATLYRHALWLIGDPDAAADLIQDTYYEAWKSLCRCRPPRHEMAWLLAILRRQAGKAYRLRVTCPECSDACLEGVVLAPDADLDAVLDLMRALQSLPLAQRDLLLHYALHGLSYEELAVQLEVPLGTVMSRMARARRALQKIMGHGETDDRKVIALFGPETRQKRA